MIFAACSSNKSYSPNNTAYIPTSYQEYSVAPYEDQNIKIENTSSDFRNRTEGAESSTKSVRLTLKKTNTIVKIRKIKNGRRPSFQDSYELYISNSDTKLNSSILGDECGKFVAYVPTRGLVCWSDGDQRGGNGKLVFDERAGKVNLRTQAPFVQIYRSHGENDLIADKTLLIDINRTPDVEKNKGALWYKGDARLYVKGQDKEVASYTNLYDFLQVREAAILPHYMVTSENHLQLAQLQNNSLLEVVTLNSDLSQKSRDKDIFIARQAPDTPSSLDFHAYSYKHGLDDVDYEVVGKNLRRNKPSHMSYSFLKSHPTQDHWFVFLGHDGEDSLPTDAVGMIPILVEEDLVTNSTKERGAFLAIHGWIVAYLDNNNKVVYGWGSPELSWFSGPIWKDFYLHDRKCSPKFVHKKAEFSETSTGCYLLQYIGYYPGKDSASAIGKYGKADFELRFVHGPFIVAQNMDETWQVYTQQAYLFDSKQPNLATYNRPNNFNGSLPRAKTDKEAIQQTEKWLGNYLKGIEQRIQERHQTLLVHFDTIEQRNRDERVRAKMAQYEAEQKERDRLRMEAEARQDAIRAAQRANARATAMSAIESGSFTNRLRNMSSAGSSSRAINSLNTMTNRLRQAQGKGYQSR